MSYRVLYNPALLINEIILFGDTLLNMPFNVTLLPKNQFENVILSTLYQYMIDSWTTVARNTLRG